MPFGDAPCPACGHLIWFLHTGDETRFFEPRPGEDVESWIARRIAEHLGVPEAEAREGIDGILEELRADSLDFVELVMEIDESKSR